MIGCTAMPTIDREREASSEYRTRGSDSEQRRGGTAHCDAVRRCRTRLGRSRSRLNAIAHDLQPSDDADRGVSARDPLREKMSLYKSFLLLLQYYQVPIIVWLK